MSVRFPRLSACLLALALPSSVLAQSTLPCLTPREAQAMVSFTLPDIITGLGQKCGAVLGPTSFLAQSGKEMADRYRPLAAAAWPQARPGLRKLAGENAAMLDLMPDETLKFFSAGLAATAVIKQVDPAACSDVDRILRAVAPLPPENMSMLVGILLEISSRPKAQAAVAKAKSPFNICPAPSCAGQPVATK